MLTLTLTLTDITSCHTVVLQVFSAEEIVDEGDTLVLSWYRGKSHCALYLNMTEICHYGRGKCKITLMQNKSDKDFTGLKVINQLTIIYTCICTLVKREQTNAKT